MATRKRWAASSPVARARERQRWAALADEVAISEHMALCALEAGTANENDLDTLYGMAALAIDLAMQNIGPEVAAVARAALAELESTGTAATRELCDLHHQQRQAVTHAEYAAAIGRIGFQA